ncbi:ABC transporter substrate-binding protein [Rothia endophytica]|uniref:ABC transporter substrate-binding protein n=1 Tax=Rothia endophytica TaxID=1324766 RepID=A0ABP9B5V1_9MICC
MNISLNTTSLNRRRFLGVLGIGASVSALTACGISGETAFGTGTQGGPIIVGSADFPESQIIAEIYAAALNQRGISAETRPAIGAREAYIGALQEGSVGVVPDYSGNLLLYFDAQSTAVTAEEIIAALPQALGETLAALKPSTAENKDSMVITSQTAQKLGLRSLDNLSEHNRQLVLGAPPEFAERGYGLPGLEKNYGFTPQSFEPINDGGGPLTVKALLDDQVQIADLFSTDPAIIANDLVVLEDPKNNFLPQQVLPVINGELVSYAAAQVLNEVSAVLTTEDLIALNTRVSGEEKANPATAAQDWVAEKL